MSVQPGPTEKRYAANGVTTTYTVPFLVIEAGDLKVYLNGVLQTSGYTQTGVGQPTSSVTFTVAPTGDLYFVLEVPFQRLTDYQENGDFLSSTVNRDFDRIWQALKQLLTTTSRSPVLGVNDVDGEGWYQAKGNGLRNLRDPELAQDAATMSWTDQFVAGLLAGITGPINNSANVFYRFPDGMSHVVQDLASTIGAYGIGWRTRTVADRLNDVANAKDFGAIADGTSHPLSERFATLVAAQAMYPHVTALTQSIDWAAAQAALNAGTPRVHFPGGRYILSDNLSRTTSVILKGDGTTSLEFAASKRLTIEGSLTALPALGANITPASRSVTFSSAPSLAASDVFLAYNPTDYSWSPHRAYYRAGEFFRCHSVTGNSAAIYGLPADTYTVAAMSMYKVNGVQVSLEDIVVKADAATIGAPVVIRFGVGVKVSNFRGSGGASYQIEIDRCYQVDILGGSALNNSAYVDDEYGVLISNSQLVTITGGGHCATRHAIAIGGGDNVGAVPNRDILVQNLVLSNSATDIGASDIHGNSDRITYNNCTINTHANMAGRNATYKGCRIYGRTSPSDGMAIYGSEIVGGTFIVENCTLIVAGDLANFGAVTLSMTQALVGDLSFIVRGLTVKGSGGGALGKLVKISVVNGETKKCNVDVRGVRCELSQALCVLFVRCEANTSQTVVSDGHIVDDVYGPSGMYMIYPTGAALTGIPTREMTQAGYVNITSTAAQVNPAAVGSVNFRYPYSKLPMAMAGVSSQSGAAQGLVGSVAPTPVVYELTNTGIRPAIVSHSGSFTAGIAVRLHWSAGIAEI
jgi:hypothetical protein